MMYDWGWDGRDLVYVWVLAVRELRVSFFLSWSKVRDKLHMSVLSRITVR